MTLQQLIQTEMESQPVYIDLINQKLLNISALAYKFQPMLEKKLNQKVEITTISMQIRRFIEKTPVKKINKYEFPKDIEITTKTNLYEVAIQKSTQAPKIMAQLQQDLQFTKGDFFSIFEGTYEILLLTNQKNKELIKKAIKKESVTSERENLAYITVNWENCTKEIPGIYYRITQALAFKEISIESFHTVGAEMMIFVLAKDLLAAHETIRYLFEG